MSEFNLAAYEQQHLTQRSAHPQPEVEWVSTTGTSSYAGNAGFNYGSSSNLAGQFGTFEDEPPLLEELGVDIPKILRKTQYVLTYRLSKHDLEDLDLGGPLVFVAILGAAHLLTAKFNFGVLLGWSVVCSMTIWFVVSSMAGPEAANKGAVDLYSCMCLLGYGMLPMVLYALISLLIPRYDGNDTLLMSGTACITYVCRGLVSNVLAVACTLWAAHTASKLFTKRTPLLEDYQSLIAYPCLLMYSAFALLTVYKA